MGRPRSDADGLSALGKIENAFWKILENEGYKNITILRLAQETGLNRNSIIIIRISKILHKKLWITIWKIILY